MSHKRLPNQGRSYSSEVREDCRRRYEAGESVRNISARHGGSPSPAMIYKWIGEGWVRRDAVALLAEMVDALRAIAAYADSDEQGARDCATKATAALDKAGVGEVMK